MKRERFEIKEGIVIDVQTGLMWMRDPLDNLYTFDEACKLKLDFGGFNDWRLPTIEELSSIINFDNMRPYIFEEFVYSGKREFRSSSSSSSTCSGVYGVEIVDFRRGCVCYTKREYECSVRLVRVEG